MAMTTESKRRDVRRSAEGQARYDELVAMLNGPIESSHAPPDALFPSIAAPSGAPATMTHMVARDAFRSSRYDDL